LTPPWKSRAGRRRRQAELGAQFQAEIEKDAQHEALHDYYSVKVASHQAFMDQKTSSVRGKFEISTVSARKKTWQARG